MDASNFSFTLFFRFCAVYGVLELCDLSSWRICVVNLWSHLQISWFCAFLFLIGVILELVWSDLSSWWSLCCEICVCVNLSFRKLQLEYYMRWILNLLFVFYLQKDKNHLSGDSILCFFNEKRVFQRRLKISKLIFTWLSHKNEKLEKEKI